MKKLKKAVLIFIVLLSKTAIAQVDAIKDYEKFERSFFSIIDRYNEQVDICNVVICMMKIETDGNKVTAINLSDSADSALIKRFQQKKEQLNIQSLQTYLAKISQPNMISVYLIPITYSRYNLPCSAININTDKIIGYCSFNEKAIEGNVMFLKSMNFKVKIQQ